MTHRCLRLAIACVLAPSGAIAADWMQFGYDAAHSGYNAAESTLSPSNVAHVQRRYQVTLPSSVDGAPVYLGGVSTSHGTKDLLFLLAEDGTLMALDAADSALLWSHQVDGKSPTTSSPAIDPGRQYVYAYGLDGAVHKYRVDTGSEVTSGGWPETVTAKTDVEKVAGSLTIAASGSTTFLYAVSDGYSGDAGDYQGHLTTIDLSNGHQTVFNTLCSDNSTHLDHGTNNCPRPLADDFGGSGIWGRGGATFDAGTNRVYVSTGNGWFDANMPGNFDWGDSVLALAANGIGHNALPLDSYTPDNYLELFNSDTDLGSVSLAIVPLQGSHANRHLGVQLGKDANVRVIDLDNMSGTGLIGEIGGELQLGSVPQGGDGMSEQPAMWIDPQQNTWLLIANRAGVSGLKLRFSGNTPIFESQWERGGQATSAIVANGVLYYAAACAGGFCLNAANPVNGTVLWTSSEHIAGLHWQSPIIVDGAIYIADGGSLHRFDANIADDTIFQNGFERAAP